MNQRSPHPTTLSDPHIALATILAISDYVYRGFNCCDVDANIDQPTRDALLAKTATDASSRLPQVKSLHSVYQRSDQR